MVQIIQVSASCGKITKKSWQQFHPYIKKSLARWMVIQISKFVYYMQSCLDAHFCANFTSKLDQNAADFWSQFCNFLYEFLQFLYKFLLFKNDLTTKDIMTGSLYYPTPKRHGLFCQLNTWGRVESTHFRKT